jgi:hypothetical protein
MRKSLILGTFLNLIIATSVQADSRGEDAIEQNMLTRLNPELASAQIYDIPVSSKVAIIYGDAGLKIEDVKSLGSVNFSEKKTVIAQAKKDATPKTPKTNVEKKVASNNSPKNLPSMAIEQKANIVTYASAGEGVVSLPKPEVTKELVANAKANSGFSIGATPIVKSPFKIASSTEKTLEKSNLRGDALKKELFKTYLSDNKYLSPIEYTHSMEVAQAETPSLETPSSDSAVASDVPDISLQQEEATQTTPTLSDNSASEQTKPETKETIAAPSASYKSPIGDVPLQLKIEFEPQSAAITSDNLSFIRSFAKIAENDRRKAVEISLTAHADANEEVKRLTAKRLAIISNVLRNNGIEEKRIIPVLSERNTDSIVMRIINAKALSLINVGIPGDSARAYEAIAW